MTNFVTNILEVVRGHQKDYEKLKQYHYLPNCPRPNPQVWKLRAKHPHTKSLPDPIAVFVIRMPIPGLRARNYATNNFFNTPPDRSGRLKLVNKHIRCAARLIVDPYFRRLGVATKLIREVMQKQTIPIIEASSPIDFSNKILTDAGFQLHYTPAPTYYRKFYKALEQSGIEKKHLWPPEILHRRILSLNRFDRHFLEYEIRQFLHQYKNKEFMTHTLERTKYILSKIPFPEAYFIWHNPTAKIPGLTTRDPARNV